VKSELIQTHRLTDRQTYTRTSLLLKASGAYNKRWRDLPIPHPINKQVFKKNV